MTNDAFLRLFNGSAIVYSGRDCDLRYSYIITER